MKQHSRLALACKVVAAVYFGVNLVAAFGNVVLTFGSLGRGAWMEADMWLALFLRLLLQAVGAFVPSLILWGVGTLLDQQQQDRRKLERIAKRLDGEEESVPEDETETLEGFIPVDDVVSLDQPTQEP